MAKKKVKAVGKFLFVIRDAPPEEVGGILMPETNLSKPNMGKIVTVGGSVEDINIKAGRKAVFNPNSGFNIELMGVEYVVLNEGQVIAVW